MENINKAMKKLQESKRLKESYTAREEFEAGLKRYLANNEDRSEDDIKVLAETKYYLLSGSRSEDNSSEIHLTVFMGKDDEDMLPNVYIDQDYKGKVILAQVNWSAYGSKTAQMTKHFIEVLKDAADFAEQISGKDYSSEF